ncbi:hypothetical protein ACIA8G_34280 [Lentzea sp. NPDC051213]|uniref:hypothetical protein n=1 Tax=Lentzea sp. NPDC051213 TaxID=3364126 RepID=UPI0037B2907E
MAKLDFLADVVQTGTIMGLDANLGPDAASAVLGDGFGENWSSRVYWRAYGLVDLSWYRRERGLGLQGEHWSVQAHRLERDDAMVDDAIAARYGRFAGPQMFDELQQELTNRGVELIKLEKREQYWQPDAQTTLHVDPATGTVQNIVSAYGEDHRDTFDADHRAVWQQLKEVAAMPEPARVRWAERNAPDRAWWRYCTRLTANRTASHDHVRNRQDFVQFTFWMWHHGLTREAFTPKEVALHQANFVARLEELHPEIQNRLSHDEVVNTCLDHVSPEMTRDDKNLIDAANLLRHGLTNPRRFDEIYALRARIPTT